ncbi:MAG TPA: uroporphyrinogen decarboxylase [Candidatus Marinimicrobia bacterium]|nr:uroporphyrinogen decarboxylase [Candidatus Neomarinimicrobiota bacterium]
MNDKQWETLLKVIRGEPVKPLPVAFIIDCPWLPNWYGISILDYFTSEELWLNANFKAIQDFPDVLFLPGFWSEYGMCTEPSAFGARCRFPSNEFPHAFPVIQSVEEIQNVGVPDPETDGLAPLVLNRLKLAQPKIEVAGHKIRFAVARGPLNVASFLMGTTEFMMAMMEAPDAVVDLMGKVTEYLKKWLQLQRETFPTIDGIFLLDDIIGFIGEPEFRRFGLPYFKELFNADVTVKFLHNDASCKVSAPFLPEMGVNLFNMGFDIPLKELQKLTGNRVTLMGNIPPRDVLASGSPADVQRATVELLESLSDKTRILPSCGGGMPPGVSSENVQAFCAAVRDFEF